MATDEYFEDNTKFLSVLNLLDMNQKLVGEKRDHESDPTCSTSFG